MKRDIRGKLQDHLLKASFEESDVVYILSRIRKLIEIGEIETNQNRYEKLEFFCNWALHVQIDRVVPVSDLLIEVEKGAKGTFEIYQLFCFELQKFLEEYHMSTSIFNSDAMQLNFLRKLSEVYRDTPLVVKEGKKKLFTFTFTESDIGLEESFGIPVRSFGSTFRIEHHS